MSRAEIVNAVIAKHEAPAGVEPAPDTSGAPPAGASGAGSASADVEAPAGEQPSGSPASPEATIDHDVLQAKLTHDRNARRSKQERKRAREEREAAEAARKEAEAAKAKWSGVGKDKTWLETVKELGYDPRKAFEEMQAEARKAGTPEAQLEAMGKAFDAKLAAALEEHVNPLKKTIEQITKERDEANARADHQGFVNDFQRALGEERFKPLLDEYEPQTLFHLVHGLKNDPSRIFMAAKQHNVPLTSDDGSFTMLDIFNVMRATQAAHQQRMQRRTQSAAPQVSEAGQQQPPQAKAPVNGTVERNAAPTTIGNDLAAASASEREKLAGMTRQQRVAYLAKKYPGS
jgi:hypothetical protein